MEQPRNGAETHALPPSASAPRAEAGTVARNSIFIKRIAAPGIAFPSGPHAGALASIALVGTVLAWTLAALPFATAAACIAGFAPFCLIAVLIVDRLNPLHPHATFGLANSLTLVRAGSACLFAALAFEPSLLAGPNAWWALTGATFLLALDGIDGALARRQGVASPFGARFDLETDALLILALAGVAFGLGKAGPWILGLGLLRYGFVLAGWFVPSLSCPLPPPTAAAPSAPFRSPSSASSSPRPSSRLSPQASLPWFLPPWPPPSPPT